MPSRRTVVLALLAPVFDHARGQAPQGVVPLPRPDPATFESGDLLWPKKPGAYVPYNAGSSNSPQADRDQWTAERDAYVRRILGAKTQERRAIERAQYLRSLDFREFLAIYAGDQRPGVPGMYSGGAVYVGHVGIVDIEADRTPWVIEALVGKGVVRQTYKDWITQRADQVIWLGRLRQLDAATRLEIAQQARLHVGRPYDFWNFNLNDDSGFYCSKLVWLSVYRALHFAIDGKEDPDRGFWLSPKQVLYLPVIDRLHDPGPYAVT